jgi:porin
MTTRYFFALAIAACFTSSAVADEEKTPDWNATTLTGDWGGTRASLYNKGVDLGFTHKSDFMANASGGIKRGAAWMGHTEARITMDMEKLAGWNATSAYLHFHSDLGSKFGRDYAGAFVGVDNIETAANTAQFYHAWIQKSFSGDSLSVLAGLYPVDSEFYVTDTSGLFIQPPYGMANDMAQSGQVGPPIFPMGALALRVKYTSPGKNFYAQYALTDGVPGDPNNPYGTHIQLNSGDGTLSVMEFGLTPQESSEPPFKAAQPGELIEPETKVHEEAETFNKTAIGFWHYTTQFDDLVDLDASGNPVRRTDQGIYLLSEHTLMAEKDHPSQGLSGFARFGMASSDIHQADWTGSVGLRYHGLVDGRDDDIAGIAVTFNHTSDKFKSTVMPGAASYQTQVEATYRAQINPWFALQPTLQYIASPNMDPALQNIWIVGARAEVSF